MRFEKCPFCAAFMFRRQRLYVRRIILTGHIEAFGQPARGADLTTLRRALHSRGELRKLESFSVHEDLVRVSNGPSITRHLRFEN